MQLLWEALDDEYMGFGRQRSKRGTFAMMCHAIIHCRSLKKPWCAVRCSTGCSRKPR